MSCFVTWKRLSLFEVCIGVQWTPGVLICYFVNVCCWGLSSSWHVTLRLTVFEIFVFKWQKCVSQRPKNGPPEPLSWPRIWWPRKLSLPKGEKLVLGLYCRANFYADRCHLRRDIRGHTKNRHTRSYDKTHTGVCVCRISECIGDNTKVAARRSVSECVIS